MAQQTPTSRTDILVPIITPTETSHIVDDASTMSQPNHQSQPQAEQQPQTHPYNADFEDQISIKLLEYHANLQNIITTPSDPEELEAIRAEAQAIVTANSFTVRKAMRAYLEEEIAKVAREAEDRARRRRNALETNMKVEQEIGKLEERYKVERRVMERKIEAMKGK